MTRGMVKIQLILLCLSLMTLRVYAQVTSDRLTPRQQELYDEHIVAGQPDGKKPVFVRQGYVVSYSEKYRIPNWTAYHIEPSYVTGLKRERRFKTFRRDPEITANPVVTEDYTGSGYARGHMVPFFAMGGDRDHNGIMSNPELATEDPYDDTTVFQANYMSNIAPQHQDALNGPGGPWYSLETAIRTKLIEKHRMQLNIYAGTIILDEDNFVVLKNKKGKTSIAIPDEFYQILIFQQPNGQFITGAFLFQHVDDPEKLPHHELLEYLVTIDDIEKKTKLDFLNTLSKSTQQAIESKKNFDFWNDLINK